MRSKVRGFDVTIFNITIQTSFRIYKNSEITLILSTDVLTLKKKYICSTEGSFKILTKG
jgi:hypothetical protein